MHYPQNWPAQVGNEYVSWFEEEFVKPSPTMLHREIFEKISTGEDPSVNDLLTETIEDAYALASRDIDSCRRPRRNFAAMTPSDTDVRQSVPPNCYLFSACKTQHDLACDQLYCTLAN